MSAIAFQPYPATAAAPSDPDEPGYEGKGELELQAVPMRLLWQIVMRLCAGSDATCADSDATCASSDATCAHSLESDVSIRPGLIQTIGKSYRDK